MASEDLERACGLIRELNFKAENRDKATEAFEALRKAVTRAMRLVDPNDCDVFANLEPKVQLAEFLMDVSARYAPYRSRVAEVIRALQKFESWAPAVQANEQNSAATQGQLHEVDVVGKGFKARHVSSHDGANSNATSQLPHLLTGASMGGSRRTACDPWSASGEMSQAWGSAPKSQLGSQAFWSTPPRASDYSASNPFKVDATNNSPSKRVVNWNAYVVAN
jgi:hypothetical protein